MGTKTDSLQQQIYRSMDLKGTQELIGILRANNRNEWTDEAFKAIREVLKNRNIENPEQYVIESQVSNDTGGSHVMISRIAPRGRKSFKCPKCRSEAWNGVYCTNCGYKQWGQILVMLIVGLIFTPLFIKVVDAESNDLLSKIIASVCFGLPGPLTLLVGIYYIISIIWPKRHS